RPMLFVGFSMHDAFVMNQFRQVLELTSNNSPVSYCLMTREDQRRLADDRRYQQLQFVDLEDYGDLARTLDDLADDAGGRRNGFAVTQAPAVPKNNLPPRRSLRGRDGDIERLETLISTEQQVTLAGLGGIGKSALALEFACRQARTFPGGVWWMDAAGAPEKA